MGQSIGERVAALEERAKARDIEMRDMKDALKELGGKLDDIADGVKKLVASENQRVGALNLGKFIAGTGVLGALGTGALVFWHGLAGK